jgi:hypothetical protein
VSPAAGVWYSDVTISGAGCTDADGPSVIVGGRIHSLDVTPAVAFGNFSAEPAADGTWRAQVVVTHVGELEPDTGESAAVAPGHYEVRAGCGVATQTQLGNWYPAEPYLATYAAPFTVAPGGPRLTLTADPATITATDDLALFTASGDRCRRPDGDTEGIVSLSGPEGTDPDGPAYLAGGAGFTPGPDGRWSATVTRRPDLPRLAAGTYRLTAWCMLGTAGFESANAFEYPPATVTVVNPADAPAPAPPAPVTAVRATPVYTG